MASPLLSPTIKADRIQVARVAVALLLLPLAFNLYTFEIALPSAPDN